MALREAVYFCERYQVGQRIIFPRNGYLHHKTFFQRSRKETLTIEIIQEGREPGQGIAYLEDGTMVVVEDGRDHIKTQANVTVTKVLQTAAGRMIFSRIRTDEDNSGDDTSN